jgi:sec-independent protein translocase protein TatA
MGGPGLPELALIIAIVIILFGARRIPEVAKGLGQGIRGLEDGLHADSPDQDTSIK